MRNNEIANGQYFVHVSQMHLDHYSITWKSEAMIIKIMSYNDDMLKHISQKKKSLKEKKKKKQKEM